MSHRLSDQCLSKRDEALLIQELDSKDSESLRLMNEIDRLKSELGSKEEGLAKAQWVLQKINSENSALTQRSSEAQVGLKDLQSKNEQIAALNKALDERNAQHELI